MQIVSTWKQMHECMNVKSCLLEKLKKYHQFVVCCISPESGKD